jgi:hypothetical protein
MANQQCETCVHYNSFPIVRMEGECTDPSKAIYVGGERSNESPSVFDFSWCSNHKPE